MARTKAYRCSSPHCRTYGATHGDLNGDDLRESFWDGKSCAACGGEVQDIADVRFDTSDELAGLFGGGMVGAFFGPLGLVFGAALGATAATNEEKTAVVDPSAIRVQSLLEGRLATFIDWIAPPTTALGSIKEQAAVIRREIAACAQKDGLRILAMPESGSFAKGTGLRRHLRGHSVVEGLDVDLPFVVALGTSADGRVQELLGRFCRYAETAYPTTKRATTKSSVKLTFSDELNYDLVPMLADAAEGRQVLLRADGERRETAVERHIEFVTRRTAVSGQLEGRVAFNECVRLLKWWRYFRQDTAKYAAEVPSIVIDLLAAKAFDLCGVRPTYSGTMVEWCGWLARAVHERLAISFVDFGTEQPEVGGRWVVRDPVNPGNNVVAGWSGAQIGELGEWFTEARAHWAVAIKCDVAGDDGGALQRLEQLLGSPVRHHCE